MYLLAGTHASILMGTGFFRDVENDFIIFSAEFFLIAYIFAVCWVEDIIHPFDKKKK